MLSVQSGRFPAMSSMILPALVGPLRYVPIRVSLASTPDRFDVPMSFLTTNGSDVREQLWLLRCALVFANVIM